jgi:excisionase family DNA binding protein
VRVWVSTYEAAEMLGKSDWWVRDRLDAGILRGERTGRNWRVDATSVEELKRRSRNF